jgi:hypothetical protein
MRNDSAMNPGRMHLQPKREYGWGDDHTSTMFAKKQAMDAGIQLPRAIRYVPQHRRSARGIVAGVVIGIGVWLLLGGTALMVWRMLG